MFCVQLVINGCSNGVENNMVIFNAFVDGDKSVKRIKRKSIKMILNKVREYFGIEGYYIHLLKAMKHCNVCKTCLNNNCDNTSCFPYYMIKYDSQAGHQIYGASINDKEVEEWFVTTNDIIVTPVSLNTVNTSIIWT